MILEQRKKMYVNWGRETVLNVRDCILQGTAGLAGKLER